MPIIQTHADIVSLIFTHKSYIEPYPRMQYQQKRASKIEEKLKSSEALDKNATDANATDTNSTSTNTTDANITDSNDKKGSPKESSEDLKPLNDTKASNETSSSESSEDENSSESNDNKSPEASGVKLVRNFLVIFCIGRDNIKNICSATLRHTESARGFA